MSVSVIIPCFNQGQFVDEAVASIQAQTYQDFEIIIVNDGSTDDETNRLLADYTSPKTRVIVTDNQGLAAARNNGIREARGEYILPLDADDRIGTTYLEQAVQLLDSQKELGIVYCRAQLFGGVDAPWRLPEFSLEEMLLDNVIFCSAVFRRQDWEGVKGYDTDFKYGWEDYDFWLSLLERGRRVYQIPEILFYYRVSADSMVRARPRQHKVETFARIFRKRQQLYADHIEVWVDKLLDVREQYHQAVLQPAGNQTEVKDSIRKVDLSTRRLQFQLSSDVQADSFVFLPADSAVVVRIDSVFLAEEKDNKRREITFTHNADFSEDNTCFFCSSEPVVQLSTLNEDDLIFPTQSLVVELEYLAFGSDCIPLLADLFKDKKKIDHVPAPPVEPSFTANPMSWIEVNKILLKRHLKSWRYYLRNPHYRVLKQSGLFDADYYLSHNKHVDPLLIDPLIHYVEAGWREQRNPNPLFEAIWYRDHYQIDAEQDPLLHYIEEGWQAGNNPNLLFFTSYYAEQYPESTFKGCNPLSHYLHHGWQEGKNPNPVFDSAYYLECNPKVRELGRNPLYHYYHIGNGEQRSPMPFFDMRFYCEVNPTVVQEWLFPILHFIEHGDVEQLTPNRFFDPKFYQEKYQEQEQITGSSAVELFLHFVSQGAAQQLLPSELFDPEFYSATYPESLTTHFHPLAHYQEQGVFTENYPCPEVAGLQQKPTISILTPVFNTDEQLLRRCIHSVLYQAYPHWELCLVDDGSSSKNTWSILKEYAAKDKRIKIYRLTDNQGISVATNRAAELASGEYIGFLDHDDELTFDALYHVVDAINEFDPDVLYSDEDLVDRESRYLESFYKPDYNPELLLCHNYITHFCIVRTSLFNKVEWLSADCAGAQDFDLLLKVTEYADQVHHIRRSIYKWRATETSTSVNHNQKDYADGAGLHALQSAVTRRGIQANVNAGQWKYYYELHRLIAGSPHVTVIVLLSDSCGHPTDWLQTLMKNTGYQHVDFQLLHRNLVDNDQMSTSLFDRVTFHAIFKDETDAAALNRIATNVKGEHLVFLSPDVMPQERNWLEIFLGYSLTTECGIVSGMVLNEDGQVDNLAIPDITDSSYSTFRSFLVAGSCHLNGIGCPQNILAASFDFCMVQQALFEKVNGLDAAAFPAFLYDIDLSLRLRKEGVEHVFTPFCTAISTDDKTISSSVKWDDEKALFQKKWRAELMKNPYYNENRLLAEPGISREKWQRWVAGI